MYNGTRHRTEKGNGGKMLSLYLALIDDIEEKNKFEQLYLLHRFTMLKAAENILRDRYLAEDAVHEAFLRLLSHLDKIEAVDCNRTRAFVVIVVKNISLDMLRSKNRHPESELEEWEDLPAGHDNSPEQLLLDKESREEFAVALSAMKKTYADVLALSVTYELNDREIAGILNITAANVRVRLHRGRQELIRYFGEGTNTDGSEE